MATVVNSKKEKLPLHEILLTYLSENMEDKDPKKVSRGMAGLIEKTVSKGAELEQLGNTVFFSFQSEQKNKTVVKGMTFNLDTAHNMSTNLKKYLRSLSEQGVDYWYTGLENKTYFPMAKAVLRKLEPEGFKGKIRGSRAKENSDFVFIVQMPNKGASL
tara:strand:+ start:523 stop:999 length:477 start_codon:yes stop_codon:yes gene_type:complete